MHAYTKINTLKTQVWTGDVAQLGACLASMHEALGYSTFVSLDHSGVDGWGCS